MIISGTTRLVVRPADYESITIERSVTHEFDPEIVTEEEAIDTVQRVLDEAMRTDVNEAVACVPEGTFSFIDTWKVGTYDDNA